MPPQPTENQGTPTPPSKHFNWNKFVFNVVIAVSSLFVLFIVISLFIDLGAKNQNANENDAIPLASESVEIVGPITVESARSNYEMQAQYNNNISLYATESGKTVAYGTDRSWYYVENGQSYGPETTERGESADEFWARMESKGWGAGITGKLAYNMKRSDSKSGHLLESVPTGPIKDCFDTRTPSQSSLIYDGKQVGLHTILDGKCSSPVEGALLSDDGLHYAYLVRAQHGYFVMVDGKKSSIYPMMGNLHFEGDVFVFNAIATDFMNFVRVKIATN